VQLVAFVAVLAAWHSLPAVPNLGYSSVEGVRAGRLAVFVAGATYDAKRVKALAYDVRAGRWRRLPRAPLRWRSGQVTLAAGRRVIVWGGASDRGRLRNGAILEDGRWRRMAGAPIHGFKRAAVWTGREMIVPAGAAYDPAADRWRRIRRTPFRPRAAVWTGRRVLVLGARVAAAYDPARERWRALAPPPIRAGDTPRAVWTGREMLVYTGSRGASYNPHANRWRLLGRPPFRAHRSNFTAVWNGRELLIWGGVRNDCGDCFLADGAALDPTTNRWRRLPPSPLAPRDRHAAVPIRGGMVVWAGCCRGAHQLADGAVLSSRLRQRASRGRPPRAAPAPARRARAHRRCRSR
jgi:Kelch motif